MTEFSGIKGSIKLKRLKKLNGKDILFNIDHSVIDVTNNDGYDIPGIIRKAETKEEFRKLLIRKMAANIYYGNQNDNAKDLSLMIGLNFDVFRLYMNGETLAPQFKEELLGRNLNKDDTQKIIDNYKSYIYLYAEKNYNNMTKERFDYILNKMSNFDIDELYPDNLWDPNDMIFAIDIGKLIMGIKLLYDSDEIAVERNDILNGIRTGYFIKYFNDLNKKYSEKHHKKTSEHKII